MPTQPILAHEPLLFTALKALCRSRLRGGYRLFAVAERFSLLRGFIRYFVDAEHPIYVPVGMRWDRTDILNYERELVRAITEKASAMPSGVTLVDCGADFGLISVLLLSQLPAITDVVAFEPNDEAHAALALTLSNQLCRARALCAAVGSYVGFGELCTPDYDQDGHARYLAPAERDGIPVTTIDSVLAHRPEHCIIKLDIEGGELDALIGARQCVAAARMVVIAIEAHPKVAARTGRDPIEVLRYLADTRTFEFMVAEDPARRLDVSRPFFEQVEPDRIYNIVCTSVGCGPNG
ncbi:FkbM family methyltransferase [Mesorhizobium sp. BAC0120]|uniref:FkbM family methyltransferase n=1 Tax=Mesorhizobium sp. BAC0120 TaxID=3090670 RepID=UPI00298CD851|nr:FkbM family methyltransferase [Mesorhizobium sp. BAC0120]MDW6023073.1 FkbM family methyltransferase [Mesorhizobium sp. BAC0120]